MRISQPDVGQDRREKSIFRNSGKFQKIILQSWAHRRPFRQNLAGTFGNFKRLAFHYHRSKVVHIIRKILTNEKSGGRKQHRVRSSQGHIEGAHFCGLNRKMALAFAGEYIWGFKREPAYIAKQELHSSEFRSRSPVIQKNLFANMCYLYPTTLQEVA